MRSFDLTKLLQRILTIIVYVPAVMAALYMGELPFFIAVLLVSIVSLQEMYHMYNIRFKQNHDNFYYGYLFTTLLLLSVYMQETRLVWENFTLLVSSSLIIAFFVFELCRQKIYFLASSNLYLLRSILYIGLMYTHVLLLRDAPYGLEYCLYLFFVVSGNDVFAYLVGIPFGRHPLAQAISPQKSVEGAAGGILGGVLLSLLLFWLANLFWGFPFHFWQALGLGTGISALAQIGDLIESLLKRALLTKDFGSLLPGHGGLLDRMDSFVLTFPAFYYFVVYFVNL
ncbi:MAG: phosphatidate cytidylyltransferase [Candidatus Margulisbacteria bacterium]|jgi:phosphatidate cytidylyltransferase|nr:phosphatidate cytidylyltransferase [Candidatus Margulisiibacteriota bacterium]